MHMDIGQHIVVYDTDTDEVLFSLDCDRPDNAIVKSGVGYKIYDGSAPVFMQDDDAVKVRHDACIVKLHKDK